MKKQVRLWSVLLALTLAMTGCSSDDNGDSDTSGDLVGTWRMVEFTYSGETAVTAQGATTTTNFDGVGQELDFTVTFSENPNEVVASGSYDIELTFDTAGQSQSQTVPVNDVLSEGTWSRDGNVLTTDVLITSASLPGSGSSMSSGDVIIEELSATTLRLSSSQQEDLSQGGISVISSVSSMMVFSRE